MAFIGLHVGRADRGIVDLDARASGASKVQTCPTPLHDTTEALAEPDLAVWSRISPPTTLHDTPGAGL
jgi:hypothetical protein